MGKSSTVDPQKKMSILMSTEGYPHTHFLMDSPRNERQSVGRETKTTFYSPAATLFLFLGNSPGFLFTGKTNNMYISFVYCRRTFFLKLMLFLF